MTGYESKRAAARDKLAQEPVAHCEAGPDYLPMSAAPTDGTIVRLLVEFVENSLEYEDKPNHWTIGTCNFSNDKNPTWLFAGWSWSHNCFTQGRGKPIGWLPMLDATTPASQPEQEPVANDRALQLVTYQMNHWRAYALELQERLVKYEGGAPMLLNKEKNNAA